MIVLFVCERYVCKGVYVMCVSVCVCGEYVGSGGRTLKKDNERVRKRRRVYGTRMGKEKERGREGEGKY